MRLAHAAMPLTGPLQVVNDGEMDLFINFACSCLHYGLSLNNIVVFAASG
jgi:hypothetical protein